MIITRLCTLTARPAELVFAEGTRHVVAGTQLLDSALAQRATADFVFNLVHPLLEFLAHSLSAAHIFTVLGLHVILPIIFHQLFKILRTSHTLHYEVWYPEEPPNFIITISCTSC